MTGATGVVGRLIVVRLLEAGYHVRALVRPRPIEGGQTTGQALILGEGTSHPRLSIYEGTLEEPERVLEALEGCAGCIHAAGLVTFAAEDLPALLKANVAGTATVANACLEMAGQMAGDLVSEGLNVGAGPVLVHLSSVAALADPAADPRTTPEPSQFSSMYGYSKHLAELECHRAGAEGLTYALLRPAVVLAPHPEGRSSASLLSAARRPWAAAPPVHLQYIDGRDVADAALAALERLLAAVHSPLTGGPASAETGEAWPGGGGAVYLLAAGGTPLRAFIEAYRRALGIEGGGVWPVPLWLARLGGRLRPIVRHFYRGPLPTARQMQAMSRPREYGSIASTERLLGRSLRPLEETLAWLAREVGDPNAS